MGREALAASWNVREDWQRGGGLYGRTYGVTRHEWLRCNRSADPHRLPLRGELLNGRHLRCRQAQTNHSHPPRQHHCQPATQISAMQPVSYLSGETQERSLWRESDPESPRGVLDCRDWNFCPVSACAQVEQEQSSVLFISRIAVLCYCFHFSILYQIFWASSTVHCIMSHTVSYTHAARVQFPKLKTRGLNLPASVSFSRIQIS